MGRIIRGLGSSSASARTGFYTVLVATINFNTNVDLDSIFNLVEKQLQKAGSNTKSVSFVLKLLQSVYQQNF